MNNTDEPDSAFMEALAAPVLSPDGVAITALLVIGNKHDTPVFRISASHPLTKHRWMVAAQHLKELADVADVTHMSTRGINVQADRGIAAEDFAIMLDMWRVDWAKTVRKPTGANDFMRNPKQRTDAAEIRDEDRRPKSQPAWTKIRL